MLTDPQYNSKFKKQYYSSDHDFSHKANLKLCYKSCLWRAETPLFPSVIQFCYAVHDLDGQGPQRPARECYPNLKGLTCYIKNIVLYTREDLFVVHFISVELQHRWPRKGCEPRTSWRLSLGDIHSTFTGWVHVTNNISHFANSETLFEDGSLPATSTPDRKQMWLPEQKAVGIVKRIISKFCKPG